MCLCIYPQIIARQRLRTATTKTHKNSRIVQPFALHVVRFISKEIK
jgi:hypothetical protein